MTTRRPIAVCLAWLVLVVAGFGIGTGVFGNLSTSVGDVPGSESDRAAELLDRVDPSDDRLAIAAVVAGRAVGDAGLRADVQRAVSEVRAMPGVVEVGDPARTPSLVAEDGKAVLIPVTFSDDNAGEDAVDGAASRLRQIDAPAVHVGGGPLLDDQMDEQAQRDVQKAELISLPIVLILLLVVFRSVVGAAMPVLVAVAGVAGTFLTLYGFSLATDVSVYAVQVTTMLGLGLAIDYGLLVVTRFREERARTADVTVAVQRTVAHAGRTVVFSGLTVATCLAGLLVFPNPFLRSMGLAGASVVVIDMLTAVTLLPALLVMFGHRIRPATSTEASGRSYARLARIALARPVAVALPVVVVLALVAVPATGLKLSVGDARSLPSDAEPRQLEEAVARHFPAGVTSDPVVAVLPGGDDAAGFEQRVHELPDVQSVERRALPDGGAVLRLVPAGPSDGPAAKGIVDDVRDAGAALGVQVTGPAARLVDYEQMLASRGPWALAVVIVAVLVLLFAFTGSALIPIRTLATSGLSLAAAVGAVVWVFQDGHLASLFGAERMGAVHLTAPPLIAAIAFGLIMDYELFILGRMREAWLRSGDHREAVVTGLQRTGRVVTCAALLLAIVFASFIAGGFVPILEIGLGLTLAVLIDATLVRMLLAPATLALLGRRAWWAPAVLRRLHRRPTRRAHVPIAPAPAAGTSPGSSD